MSVAALRVVARDLDERTETERRGCRCFFHTTRFLLLRELAADYRSAALRIEIEQREAATS
jgi:hypothetical protein